MAEIARVNDVAWEDIAEVAGVAKASIAKIGASADAPAGGVALLDNTESARTYGNGAADWARTPAGPGTAAEGPLWDLFERTNAWSVGQWVKPSSAVYPYGRRFFSGKIERNVGGFMCGLSKNVDGNTPVLEIRDQNANTIYGVGTTDLNDGDWHFAVYTYDGTSASSAIKIFVDGGADESTGSGVTLNATIKTTNLYENFKIGLGASGNPLWYADYWRGWIDEVSIWDVALSESEAAECYTEETAKTPDLNTTSVAENLVHWWRLGDGDNGSGTDDSWIGTYPPTNYLVGGNLVYDMSTSSGYAHNSGSHPSWLCCPQRGGSGTQINLVAVVP